MTNRPSGRSKIDTIIVKGKAGEAALAVFIGEMEELMPWFTGKAFRGLTIKQKDSHWMMIIRAGDNHAKLVAFVEADTLIGLYRKLYQVVAYDKGFWKEDKFAG